MCLRSLVVTSFALFLLDSTLSEAVSLSKFKNYYRGRLEIGAGFEYMTTNANFDDFGANQDLNSKSSYQIFHTPVAVRYCLGSKWSLSSALMISTAESKNFDATRNNSSLPELHLGADSLLYSGRFDIVGDVQLIYPLETIQADQDNALNTEGVTQVLGWLSLENKKNYFIWYARGGYNYRMEGRSGLVLYEAGLGLKSSSVFSFGAEVGGFQSMVDDSDRGSEAKRYAVIQRVNGGSYSYYSVNPSVAEARLWSEFSLASRVHMGLNVAYPFYGQNYSKGLTLGAVVSMSFDLLETQKSIRRLSVPTNEEGRLSTERHVEDFQEETDDGVDQEIFRPPPPPAPLPRLKQNVPVPTQHDVQNQLNDTEMTIKLRSIKKKKRK